MGPVSIILSFAVDIYIWIIIGQVALSWLINFEVVNADNPQAQKLIQLLARLTDPVYAPLKRFIPPIGGIDITPIIVIIGLGLLKSILISILISMGL